MTGVLAGIRVLDFGRFIAGPYCAALLGDLGAEVIRIEKREGSEDRWVSPVGSDGTGAGFIQMNRNKLGITLDPASEGGREVVQRLVRTADVVVVNMPTTALERLGLDYASLSALNPEIVLYVNTAYGSRGPLRDALGFDTIAAAMSGSMYLAGDGGTPMRAVVPMNDFASATLGALGIVAALMERQRSGHGQQVETSLLSTALSLADSHLIEEAALGIGRTAQLNRSWAGAPMDCFRTADGWVQVMVIGNPLFRRWARMIGEEGQWTDDPRFADDDSRGAHGELVSARMQEWCAERTTEDALQAMQEARIPAAPVLSPRQVLDDARIAATGILQDVEYPELSAPAPVVTSPVQLSRTPTGLHRRPPRLGEHTDDVLQGLGYTHTEIEHLRRAGAI